MFGSKINSHNMRHHYNSVKSFLGHKYNQTRHVLSFLDDGVRIAKHIYAVASPLIDTLTGGHHHQKVMKAIGTYDELKHRLVDANNQAVNLHQKIKHVI